LRVVALGTAAGAIAVWAPRTSRPPPRAMRAAHAPHVPHLGGVGGARVAAEHGDAAAAVTAATAAALAGRRGGGGGAAARRAGGATGGGGDSGMTSVAMRFALTRSRAEPAHAPPAEQRATACERAAARAAAGDGDAEAAAVTR